MQIEYEGKTYVFERYTTTPKPCNLCRDCDLIHKKNCRDVCCTGGVYKLKKPLLKLRLKTIKNS